jgi:hypothetical protein
MSKVESEGAEDVVEELLALPPERFTEARNAAVKQLRAAGRRDAADAVKGIPRPPVALWALNRLAREQPALVQAFAEAAEALREAYRSGGDIRAATAPEREAEARVVSAATELVRAQGKGATDTVVRSLGQTLRAAAADAGVADELRRGRLIHEPAAPSIDELLGSIPVSPAKSAAATPPARTGATTAKAESRQDRGAERRALREQISTAKSEATRARQHARAAADAARTAQAEWERAERLAREATELSDLAAEHQRALEQQLEALS